MCMVLFCHGYDLHADIKENSYKKMRTRYNPVNQINHVFNQLKCNDKNIPTLDYRENIKRFLDSGEHCQLILVELQVE